MDSLQSQDWQRIGTLKRGSRRKEALTFFARNEVSLLTSAATWFNGKTFTVITTAHGDPEPDGFPPQRFEADKDCLSSELSFDNRPGEI